MNGLVVISTYFNNLSIILGTHEDEIESEPNVPKLPDFGIEYAKVDRDLCTGCRQNIQVQEIRIMNVVYDTDRNTAFDGEATWYHVICFARSRNELGYLQSAETLPGFKRLSEKDKEMVKNQIP